MTGIKRLDGRSYMIGFAVVAIVGVAVIKGLLFFGQPTAALIAMAAVLGLALTTTFALRGRLDETGRAAEQFAWYWGAGGAMAVTLAVLGLYMAAGAPWIGQMLRGAWNPVELIALGAFGMAAAQVVGFAVAGVAWWQARS
jgi:hypothetical protein